MVGRYLFQSLLSSHAGSSQVKPGGQFNGGAVASALAEDKARRRERDRRSLA